MQSDGLARDDQGCGLAATRCSPTRRNKLATASLSAVDLATRLKQELVAHRGCARRIRSDLFGVYGQHVSRCDVFDCLAAARQTASLEFSVLQCRVLRRAPEGLIRKASDSLFFIQLGAKFLVAELPLQVFAQVCFLGLVGGY